ncbi:hypothetical protein Hdeb2414_s0788g00946961 [Helianthus debilis subsp. tardiflorus]
MGYFTLLLVSPTKPNHRRKHFPDLHLLNKNCSYPSQNLTHHHTYPSLTTIKTTLHPPLYSSHHHQTHQHFHTHLNPPPTTVYLPPLLNPPSPSHPPQSTIHHRAQVFWERRLQRFLERGDRGGVCFFF